MSVLVGEVTSTCSIRSLGLVLVPSFACAEAATPPDLISWASVSMFSALEPPCGFTVIGFTSTAAVDVNTFGARFRYTSPAATPRNAHTTMTKA